MSNIGSDTSPSASPVVPVQAASLSPAWSLPSSLPSREVFPDLWTPPSTLGQLAGKDSDPSRMGVFVCLLDDRPHLHPTLSSLHKHRLVAHSIPLPSDPSSDWPISQTGNEGEDIVMASVGILAAQPGYVTPPQAAGEEGAGAEAEEKEVKEEWFMWRFTDEEAARRKAFLPLA